jgi:hypothetical protein
MILRRRGRRRRLAVAGAVVVAAEALAVKLRSGKLGGAVVVRCRRGHLFTTTWIPGVSVKSLRLGWWRFQWCPAGRHWSIVVPARASDLSEDERRTAAATRDNRIP